ncbi:putative phage tail protein [Yersinia intermedia]|uniref:hypothetical protein n=1 Tax=Yersinia intermedia TaxID=631 RepID=UPI0005E4D369|nr:hypothetical protein [Yersinia intermedia]CNH63399.1 putative phage tail protein [Yersinia intermedia]
MAWYRSGTVTSVAGTNVITGTGTLWNNPIFGIASGQMIFVPGAGQVVIYEILSVDSDTKIRITRNIASPIDNSEYAIVTTVSNSMSDLARRTAVQLALYQKLLEDWQDITTGTGDVTIIAPDGSAVVIPSLSDLTAWVNDSKTWFDDNRELIDNAGEAVAGAETAKTAAQSAETAAEGSATSASGSATTASDAAAAATDSASIASEAATIATQSKDGAVTARDEAEQFAASVNPDLLMHTTGGTFTGPVILANDATDPKGAVTKQQLDAAINEGQINALELATEITLLATRVTTLEAHNQYIVLYPDGTQAAPYVYPVNTRKEYVNPFPGRAICVEAQVLINGIWGKTGWAYASAESAGTGLSASQINGTGNIIVQSGSYAASLRSNQSGNPHNTTATTPTAPFRLVVSTKD